MLYVALLGIAVYLWTLAEILRWRREVREDEAREALLERIRRY